jgi:hypothetical protein
MWTTTYLSSLRKEADALNYAVLSGIPSKKTFVFHAEDFENNLKIYGSAHSRIFKKSTNFATTVVCKVGAKVMFLTNSMLADKGISNGSIGVITDILQNSDVEAAFPTKDGIQVRHFHHNLKLRNTPVANNKRSRRSYKSTGLHHALSPMEQNIGVLNFLLLMPLHLQSIKCKVYLYLP